MARPLPGTWRTISPLLDEALDLEDAGRQAWLSALAARDPAAAAAVGAWLEEYVVMDARGFLEQDAVPTIAPAFAGLEIGAYRLVAPLGEGGMGTVWLAERRDGQFDQKVAVKLLHGPQLNPAITGHFAREAGILARLTHPSISRLLDAGIGSVGAPYLVLEHVSGIAIDRYCDEARLPLRERLYLFLDVLAPVAHAHAALIVHRDLKPANVLVTSEGHVKLLDFGVATLLDAPAGTGDTTHALTPAYAAPEQITGGTITTATDVYALGVLLYQLLTGRHPSLVPSMTSAALVEAILRRTPPSLVAALDHHGSGAPSVEAIAEARRTTAPRLRRQLAGDLGTIVAKALAKAPTERYATVAALEDDLRRYLRHEPVAARPATLRYRASRFARRYRAPVALAATAIVALVGGLGGTIVQARRATAQAAEATAEREFARRQLMRAEAINDLNAFLISDAAPLGATFTARALLGRAEEILSRTRGDDDTQVESLVAVGGLYSTVGETARAEAVLGRAHALAQQSRDPAIRAVASCEYGSAAVRSGDVPRAHTLIDAGLRDLGADRRFALPRIRCHLAAARVENWTGGGDRSVHHVLTARDEAAAAGLASPLLSLRMAMSLAEAYRVAGRYGDANEAFKDADRRLTALGRQDTERAAVLLNNWGLVLAWLGRPIDAERMLRRSIDISLVRGDEKSIEPVSWANLAVPLLDLGRYAEAIVLVDRARAGALERRDAMGADQALLGAARARVLAGDLVRGAAQLDEVEAHFRAMFPPTHPAFVSVAIDRIRLLERKGDLHGALAQADRALALATGDVRRRSYERTVRRRRAEVLVALKRFAEARADIEQAIALTQSVLPAGALAGSIGEMQATLGDILIGLGHHAGARTALESALRHLDDAMGTGHPLTRKARARLAQL